MLDTHETHDLPKTIFCAPLYVSMIGSTGYKNDSFNDTASLYEAIFPRNMQSL